MRPQTTSTRPLSVPMNSGHSSKGSRRMGRPPLSASLRSMENNHSEWIVRSERVAQQMRLAPQPGQDQSWPETCESSASHGLYRSGISRFP